MYALLIAEDPDDSAMFSLILQRAGLAVTVARELERAMKSWPDRPADLILVALAAPPPQTQVQRVRRDAQVPLLLAVHSNDPYLHAELLNLGADLVIPPTYTPKLLLAQISVFMRRSGSVPVFSLPTLNAPGLSLDPSTRTVQVEGKETQRLTHLEFRLLYTLMVNRNRVIPTETIVERVWGYSDRGDRDLVRGLVNRLRNKVERDPRTPRYILTMPGIGYQFSDEG